MGQKMILIGIPILWMNIKSISHTAFKKIIYKIHNSYNFK